MSMTSLREGPELPTLLFRFRRVLTVGIHLVLVWAANLAAFLLRFDGSIPDWAWSLHLQMLPWLLVVRGLTFFPFRLYEGLWRYTGIWDLRNIIGGIAASSILFALLLLLFDSVTTNYPRSVHIIDAVMLLCFTTGIRLTKRILIEFGRRAAAGKGILVYGAGDAGELIVRDMRQNPKFMAKPIGFVDDDYSKVGQRIHGVPVLGGRRQLPEILRTHAPEELLIAIPSASRETLRAIVRTVEPFKIRITTLPRFHELIGARVEVDQIRQLKVEDLLARDPVGLDYAPVRRFLEGKRVVVTGAGGSIGSELCRQVAAARPVSLTLIDRYENSLFQIHRELTAGFPRLEVKPVVADVTDIRRIDQSFDSARPQVVFHAAAHKHVPLMEENPCEAVKNNVRGTRIVAEASLRCGVGRFILISTDKAVNPTSVMGATKRIAELIVESMSYSEDTRFSAVRFGNVLASNGSVVPTFLAQISKGGPVTVTHPEMKRFFMLIPEAVQLVLHAAASDDRTPLFVLDMGEQVRVADMARDLIRLSGLIPDKDIELQFTGLRPGEKMFEELVGEGEVLEPSLLDKILRVRTVATRKNDGLAERVGRLETLALDGRVHEVLGEMRSVISDFSPTKTQSEPV